MSMLHAVRSRLLRRGQLFGSTSKMRRQNYSPYSYDCGYGYGYGYGYDDHAARANPGSENDGTSSDANRHQPQHYNYRDRDRDRDRYRDRNQDWERGRPASYPHNHNLPPHPNEQPSFSSYSYPQHQQPHYYSTPMATALPSEERERDSTRPVFDAAATASYARPGDYRGVDGANTSSQTSEINDYTQYQSRYYPPEENAAGHDTFDSFRSEQGMRSEYHSHHRYHRPHYSADPDCEYPHGEYAYSPAIHREHHHARHTEHTSPPHQGDLNQQFKETPSAVTEGTTPPSSKPFAQYDDTNTPILPRGRFLRHPTPPYSRPLPHIKAEPEGVVNSAEDWQPREHCATSLKQESPTGSSSDYEPIPYDDPLESLRQQGRADSTGTAEEDGRRSSVGNTASGEGNSWERRFEQLLEYKREHGSCNVPQQYTANTSLGIWVNKQRMEQKNFIDQKRSSINRDRIRRLESIGFAWAKRKGQASWDEKFNELLEYQKEHNTCHVPTKYKKNSALGRWVSTQRSEYKNFREGEKSCMTHDRIRKLVGIGFAWNMACL